MFSAFFSNLSFYWDWIFFLRLHCQFTDINISGECSKKLANSCLFLKEEFVELQIRLYSVENMSLKAFALKLDRAVVFTFSFWFGSGVTSDSLSTNLVTIVKVKESLAYIISHLVYLSFTFVTLHTSPQEESFCVTCWKQWLFWWHENFLYDHIIFNVFI